jgi:hypothetical protein
VSQRLRADLECEDDVVRLLVRDVVLLVRPARPWRPYVTAATVDLDLALVAERIWIVRAAAVIELELYRAVRLPAGQLDAESLVRAQAAHAAVAGHDEPRLGCVYGIADRVVAGDTDYKYQSHHYSEYTLHQCLPLESVMYAQPHKSRNVLIIK